MKFRLARHPPVRFACRRMDCLDADFEQRVSLQVAVQDGTASVVMQGARATISKRWLVLLGASVNPSCVGHPRVLAFREPRAITRGWRIVINGVDSPKPKFIARMAAFYGDVATGARRSAILAFPGRTSRCT